jgi:uncharacterized protein YbcI
MASSQHDGAARPTGGQLLAEISSSAVRVVADYTGRGPTRARTIINGDWVFITLSDGLTKGERRLVELGRDDFVRETGEAYQNAMREELTGEVERLTRRKVIAFLSDNHLDPDVGLEAMLLEPDPHPSEGAHERHEPIT